ncbi:MAG: hypothetical protein WCA20_22885 [Candidatus Sulfotelmatobacter sp.]
MTPKPVERLEKTLGRVAREQGLDQERLRRWVSFLPLYGVLECAVEKGVIDIYYLKSGVAMELRFARAARTPICRQIFRRAFPRKSAKAMVLSSITFRRPFGPPRC